MRFLLATLRINAALAIAAALGGCGGMANSVAVKGEITSIDRQCEFKRTEADGKPGSFSGDCGLGDFEKERKGYKTRVSNLKGKATVRIAYVAPGEQDQRIGEIHYDGDDDEFYALRRGDAITVLVSKDDPKKIWKI